MSLRFEANEPHKLKVLQGNVYNRLYGDTQTRWYLGLNSSTTNDSTFIVNVTAATTNFTTTLQQATEQFNRLRDMLRDAPMEMTLTGPYSLLTSEESDLLHQTQVYRRSVAATTEP